MSKKIRIALAAAIALVSVGCVGHVHHRPAHTKVAVLDNEHRDRSIVVVYKAPKRHRHCWKHHGHWHCRLP